MKLTRAEKLLLVLDFAKESVQKFWQKIYGAKLLKAFACLSILFVIFAIIFSYKPQAQSLPSCSTLSNTVTPNAGVNCLYYGLPLCSSIVAPAIARHRVNCADIIDLPLCSDIVTGPSVSASPGRNCVDLCSSPSYDNPDPVANPTWVRGVDFAIFNRDCMRFCNDVEPGIVPVPGVNCSERKCHQLTSADVPNPGVNCDLLPCNLLTPDELNKPKFDDERKKFCEGDTIKCHQFTQAQLRYMRLRALNPTCQIHNCRPSVPACGEDDTLNITNQGAAYTSVYSQYINGGLSLTSNLMCRSMNCKPVIKSQYRCVSQPVRDANGRFNIHSVGALNAVNAITGTDADIYRNPACDSSGDGSVCGTLRLGVDPDHDTISPITSYCFKTVDCNEPSNRTASECLVASNLAGDTTTNIDPFNSWFYRPKPMDKAINTRTGLLLNMNRELCYTTNQMNGEQGWGFHSVINLGLLGTIDMGWFQSSWADVHSPGACNVPNDGFRGTRYTYLCGNGGTLYNRPSYDVSYFKGYATTTFNNGVTTHKVTVCTRFKNTVALDACGARECGINEWFNQTTSQACGADVCRELTINESDETECSMSSGSGMSGSSCASEFDDYLRVRAVKYNDKVCAYLDSKGQFAYNGMFLNGTESINFADADEINSGVACVNDPAGTNGNCHGYNSNYNQGQANVWRALLRVHYVDNNRPPSTTADLKGYLDRDGKLYKEQACPKVTLRLPPPDLYNVGTMSNSEKLFAPPVTIRNATQYRGGSDAIIPPGKIYGKTDFHYPEIKVQFGAGIYKMSLGFGYTGDEIGANAESFAASPGFQTITTNFNGKTYEARLLVKKEYSVNSGMPQFCLYRKIRDQNGVDIDPLRISCVDRNPPDINNARDMVADRSLPFRKAVIYPRAGNEYNNAKINIRYLDGGANKIDNNCSGDDLCSREISLENTDYTSPTCNQDVENHKICVQREECSAIYIDCIQNEIDINNARNNNQSINAFLDKRARCNQDIVPNCNRKKGVGSSGDIFNPIPQTVAFNPDNSIYHGWFNELCIVKGFEAKLRYVIARDTPTSEIGKCFISQSSPYLTDGNPATNCNMGGRAPNCICAEAPLDYVTDAGEVIRLETPHEAGLCIDIPVPTFCSTIDYNPSPNSNAADPEYINDSLGKTTYSNSTGVHLTHQDRTNGAISGRAEFVQSLLGMNDIRGTCSGFWTYDKNSSGVSLFPQQSCLNRGGVAAWDLNVRNQCVRFSCPDVVTAGPDITGVYQARYGALEAGEAKGASNGFATWLKYTKTTDFPETRTANACIPGFKPLGSTASVTSGIITRYNGGVLPSRQCDQLGNWIMPVNACARISCPAISLRDPTSSADAALWAQWYANGGASFPSVFASRSIVRAQPGSIATGTCNNRIGFFQSPGGLPPTLECDYLGNWGVVSNPCSTSCEAINTDIQASNGNNGFSQWQRITGALTLSGVEGVFTTCVAGYVQNPYPPAFDISGRALAPAIASDLTRAAEPPRRLCRIGSSVAGTAAGVWGAVSNGCINACPGASVDPRLGVGITSHPMRSSVGSVVQLSWPSTNFGQYAYVTNWNGLESLFNSVYFQGSSATSRTNGYYLMRRFCNSNGRWSDPEALCSANDGQIGNAKYFDSTASAGYQNSIPAGTSQVVTGVCNPRYWTSSRGSGPAPQRQCVFADSNRYIDRVYLELTNSTQDCELKACSSYPGFLGARGTIAAASPASPLVADARFTAGSGQLVGSCLSNASLVAGGTLPHADCDANANWTAPDESSCKYSCVVQNRVVQPVAPHNYTLMHNYYLRTHNRSFWNSECFTDTYAYRCNDGVTVVPQGNRYSHDSRWGNDYNCRVQQYDPANNSWCSVVLYGSNSMPEISTGLISAAMGCK